MLSPYPLRATVHLYPNDEIRVNSVLVNPRRAKKDTSVFNECVQGKDGVIQKYQVVNKKNKTNINSIKPGYGKLANGRKFTSFARQSISRIGGAYQKEFGKQRLAMVTLTIPGSGEEVTKTVAEYSGYIINRIQTWLGDNWKHSNGKKYSLGCVELQERGMLHWHFLVALEDKRIFKKFKRKVEQFWQVLVTQVGEKNGIDAFSREKGGSWKGKWKEIKKHAVKVERVKKNAANYLAKYLSKTKSKYENKDKTISFTPSSWWTRSDDSVALMHAHTKIWELPPLTDEQFKEVLIPEIEDSFKSYDMWQVPHINPYTKQQIGIIGRGTEEQCAEWCEDFIPILCDMYKENISYSDELVKLKWSALWNLEQQEYELEKLCFLKEDGAPEVSNWADRYRMYWRMIYQGFPKESALEYVSTLKPETKLMYDTERGCLVEMEWIGNCWQPCQT